MKALIIPSVCLMIFLCSCNNVPDTWFNSPKSIEADGQQYLACAGTIWLYSPSREVNSSTSKSYEIVFTDDYGKSQDLTDVKSYTIRDAPKDSSYAMGTAATSDNTSTTYSNGTPLKPGDVVLWSNGDAGRAIWNGPGKWSAVPCPH